MVEIIFTLWICSISQSGSLRTGDNTITFHSETVHHGIEIMWPGPAIIVKYGSPPAPPTTSAPVNYSQQPSSTTVTAARADCFVLSFRIRNYSISLSMAKKWSEYFWGKGSSSYTTPATFLSNNGDDTLHVE
jgi:hypothetical protein